MNNPDKQEQKAGESFHWGVKIPMRDGVQLNATLYQPGDDQRVPAIFTLTPYIADGAHLRGTYFASHGYAFAAIDSRGRGNSGGAFVPLAHEAQDGHDIVEWLGRQPWCNGQVAMWGGSYGGAVQWLTLREQPSHLRTIVPTASAHAGVDFPFLKNIFYTYEVQWLTYVSGTTRNMTIMNDLGFWKGKFLQLYQQHRPYQELDKLAGNPSPHLQSWLKHPHVDAYWDAMALSLADYDAITLPILTITGAYDGDQPGAMAYYRQHMASGSPARQSHYLVMGPWDHPGTRDPRAEVGGLSFGAASLLDMNNLHREWYDWTMKGGKKPTFLKKRVAYYVTGAETWKYADSLESIPSRTQMLYLSSEGGAGDVFHSGRLQKRPSTGSASDPFTYDPLDPRNGELEQELQPESLIDQTLDLNLFGNGLVYHSEPFEQATELTGWVRLEAWMGMDVPDTDFNAMLSAILPDGRLIRLTQDLLRARYRHSPRLEKLVVPGEINLYRFDGFTFISRLLPRDSRLRLVLNCANSIYLEKNYNSGGVVAAESGKDARTAHVRLYHDAEHPSRLELPVVHRR